MLTPKQVDQYHKQAIKELHEVLDDHVDPALIELLSDLINAGKDVYAYTSLGQSDRKVWLIDRRILAEDLTLADIEQSKPQ